MPPSPSKPSRLSSLGLTKTTSKPTTPVTSPPGTPTSESDLPLDEALQAPADEEPDSETGKFRQLLSILRRSLHVADLSSMRISLPANLLEPLGNLEYWTYCDRPDFFAAMNESEDELERMLAVLRWTFTKDTKFVKSKIAKPYNSILGEHFHCHYDTNPVTLHPETKAPEPVQWLDLSPTAEVLSFAGRTSTSAPSVGNSPNSSKPPSVLESAPTIADPKTSSSSSAASFASSTKAPSLSTAATSLSSGAGRGNGENGSTRVAFINEQTSHHPPISFFCLESRSPKGTVRCVGADQLSAKFTGTTVAVFPGPSNKGLFVTLPERDNEEYQITHPTATVAGLLRGSPYATIGEFTYVTTRGGPSGAKKYRTIVQYLSESWLLKPKFAIEGVVYEYQPGTDSESWTKIKHVPIDRVVAQLEGCWRGEIRWRLPSEKKWKTLVDIVPLQVAPKTVAPLEEQHELETRKVWSTVTDALNAKLWNEASKNKQAIEQAQRVKADARKAAGETYTPAFFEPMEHPDRDWDGRPRLSEAGLQAIEKEFAAKYA